MNKVLSFFKKPMVPTCVGLLIYIIPLLCNSNRKLDIISNNLLIMTVGLSLTFFTMLFLYSFNGTKFYKEKKSNIKSFLKNSIYYLILIFFLIISSLILIKTKVVSPPSINVVIRILIYSTAVGFTEEMFCRGIIISDYFSIKKFTYKNTQFIIILSSLLFGILHVLDPSITKIFFNSSRLLAALFKILDAGITAYFFASISIAFNNIIYSSILHTIYDFVLLLVYAITNPNSLSSINIDYTSMIENNKLSIIVGIILGIPLLFISIKMLKKVNYEPENPENYDNNEAV